MPFVHRLPDGRIDSLHRESIVESAAGATFTATEFLEDGHPELLAFIGSTAPATPRDDFNRLDADFVRVIEDVIDTLITRNILNITDLPAEAQAKLFARKSFRERVSQSSLRLFEATDFGDVI
jgi:hypothetical protein